MDKIFTTDLWTLLINRGFNLIKNYENILDNSDAWKGLKDLNPDP